MFLGRVVVNGRTCSALRHGNAGGSSPFKVQACWTTNLPLRALGESAVYANPRGGGETDAGESVSLGIRPPTART